MAVIVGTNSYITISECNDILAGFLNTTEWDLATDVVKEKALRQACTQMQSIAWIGYKTDDAQTLEFPRQWVSQNGYLKDIGTPIEIKTGQAILASLLLKPNLYKKQGIKSESVDGIGSVSYDKLTDKVIFKGAYDIFGAYIEKVADLS